jgi:hypothetical protein
MTLPQYYDLCEYWRSWPPEHEMLAMLASVYTTWQPEKKHQLTEQEQIIAHRKSLEERWRAGALTPKQMYEAMGGVIMSPNADGTAQPSKFDPKNMPGVGPFPGA